MDVGSLQDMCPAVSRKRRVQEARVDNLARHR
jgi:hypothetical protein